MTNHGQILVGRSNPNVSLLKKNNEKPTQIFKMKFCKAGDV